MKPTILLTTLTLLVTPLMSTRAYANTAQQDETMFWMQLGLGILGGAATGAGGVYGTYVVCDAAGVNVSDDAFSSYACVGAMILVGVGSMLLGTTTTVWGIGEARGHDGSWGETFAGAAVGAGFGIIGGPLALLTSSVGATYFYGSSTVDNSPMNLQATPAPTTTLIQFSF